jgi:hypothetical protein
LRFQPPRRKTTTAVTAQVTPATTTAMNTPGAPKPNGRASV